MITGVYRFYENGELVSEHRNLITNAGKQVVKNFFAGVVQNICTSIAVGIDDAAAAVGDTALGFEVGRADVSAIGADSSNNRAVYKTVLPADLAGTLREIGAFSQSVNTDAGSFGSRSIFTMDSSEDWGSAVFTTANTRLVHSLNLNPAVSATASANLNGVSTDLSGYSSSDEFILAYNVADANCSKIDFRLGSDSSNYVTFTVNTPAAGYHFSTITKGAGVVTGNPNWSNIGYVQIDVTATAGGATSVDVDALRVEDMDTLSQTYALVSHSILGSPVTKRAGVPMDVEYSLGITV